MAKLAFVNTSNSACCSWLKFSGFFRKSHPDSLSSGRVFCSRRRTPSVDWIRLAIITLAMDHLGVAAALANSFEVGRTHVLTSPEARRVDVRLGPSNHQEGAAKPQHTDRTTFDRAFCLCLEHPVAHPKESVDFRLTGVHMERKPQALPSEHSDILAS